MATIKVQATKNYGLFNNSPDNRPLDLGKHRKLKASMKLYGFLKCFPIVVVRDAKGNLTVKDGQHRLAIAEELGLTVYFIEETVDFDVAQVVGTTEKWRLVDYAQKHAANGVAAYREGLDFADRHKLPISKAFALLAGTISFGNFEDAFYRGDFKIKDRRWAEDVASLYGPMTVMAPALKNSRFIEACMMVCRVRDFDSKRLLAGAAKCREKLVAYSTKEAYLDTLEEVYNFGRRQLVGLKSAAIMAMKERNIINKQAGKSAH